MTLIFDPTGRVITCPRCPTNWHVVPTGAPCVRCGASPAFMLDPGLYDSDDASGLCAACTVDPEESEIHDTCYHTPSPAPTLGWAVLDCREGIPEVIFTGPGGAAAAAAVVDRFHREAKADGDEDPRWEVVPVPIRTT